MILRLKVGVVVVNIGDDFSPHLAIVGECPSVGIEDMNDIKWDKKARNRLGLRASLAEKEGFEPSRPFAEPTPLAGEYKSLYLLVFGASGQYMVNIERPKQVQ